MIDPFRLELVSFHGNAVRTARKHVTARPSGVTLVEKPDGISTTLDPICGSHQAGRFENDFALRKASRADKAGIHCRKLVTPSDDERTRRQLWLAAGHLA
jgi:hypothetical protein